VAIGGGKKPQSKSTAEHKTADQSPSPSPSASISPTPSGTASFTPSPTPKVLLDVGGSSAKRTEKLTAPGAWDLSWSYDCSALSERGNFSIVVLDAVGRPMRTPSSINESGGKGSGTQHYDKGGQYFLSINAQCAWHITAKG
jgi:hypothetical protein